MMRRWQVAGAFIVGLGTSCGDQAADGASKVGVTRYELDADRDERRRQQCQDVKLEASKRHTPQRTEDATAQTPAPIRFHLPDEVEVTDGNAGNQLLSFTFGVGTQTVDCKYRGGAPMPDPVRRQDIRLGEKYTLLSCSNGAPPNSLQTANQFALRIEGGSARHGQTRVALELQEARPCGGGVAVPVNQKETSR